MQLTDTLSKTKKYVLTIAATLILCSITTTAEVYKSIDADGKVTFTDQPDASAEAVKINTPNTLPTVATPDRTTSPSDSENLSGYASVAISSPADNSIIANGLLPFTVAATTKPALQEGHKLQLKIDGKVHSTSSGSFAISGIHRGEHQFQVVIIDENDQVLKRSATVKVFAYRPGK